MEKGKNKLNFDNRENLFMCEGLKCNTPLPE